MKELVLVTGGNGFVGSYCIIQLLQKGYNVKTTIRSLNKKDEVIEVLKKGGITSFDNLTFIEADLSKDANWDMAVEKCDYILHVASPFMSTVSSNEDEFIKPAVEGTLRVLQAAKDAGVKRVVMTSSFGAVGYGKQDKEKIFTESDWTNPDDKTIDPYIKSKTLAEKAAWDLIKNDSFGMELSVVNPVGVFGPILNKNLSSSIMLIQQLMNGSMKKGCPNIFFGVVDVRDLADLQIRVMTNPKAKGERFIGVSDNYSLSLLDAATMIKNNIDKKYKIPSREIPNWLMKMLARFNPSIRAVLPNLGIIINSSNQKAKDILDWKPRNREETIIETAKSLIEHDLIK